MILKRVRRVTLQYQVKINDGINDNGYNKSESYKYTLHDTLSPNINITLWSVKSSMFLKDKLSSIVNKNAENYEEITGEKNDNKVAKNIKKIRGIDETSNN